MDRLLRDPESMGMSRPTYGSIRMRKITAHRSSRGESPSRRPHRVTFKDEISLPSKPFFHSSTSMGAPIGIGEHGLHDMAENIYLGQPTSTIRSDRFTASPDVDDRASLMAAQRELMKTHQEILALEEEIRAARRR